MSQVSQQRSRRSHGDTADAVRRRRPRSQYNIAGEFSGGRPLRRTPTHGNLVAQAAYGYDGDGKLTSLDYTDGASTLPSYSWTYDAAGQHGPRPTTASTAR